MMWIIYGVIVAIVFVSAIHYVAARDHEFDYIEANGRLIMSTIIFVASVCWPISVAVIMGSKFLGKVKI